MEAAAAASTPQVGWFTINTFGSCCISRPITNFCKLPPESERATFSTLGVRTSNSSIIFSVKALVFSQSIKPFETKFWDCDAVIKVFSTRLIFGAAECPNLSSGADKTQSSRLALGLSAVIMRSSSLI